VTFPPAHLLRPFYFDQKRDRIGEMLRRNTDEQEHLANHRSDSRFVVEDQSCLRKRSSGIGFSVPIEGRMPAHKLRSM